MATSNQELRLGGLFLSALILTCSLRSTARLTDFAESAKSVNPAPAQPGGRSRKWQRRSDLLPSKTASPQQREGEARRGYRIYLQKLKVPEEVSSRPKERKGEINGKMTQEKLSFAKRHAKKKEKYGAREQGPGAAEFITYYRGMQK